MSPLTRRAGALAVLLALGWAPPASGTIGPSLRQGASRPGPLVDVVILLDHPSGVRSAGASLGRPSAYAATRMELEDRNRSAVMLFRSRVDQAGIALQDVRSFWLAPFLAARVSPNDVVRLDALPGVAAVVEDGEVELVRPIEAAGAEATVDATATGHAVIGVHEARRRGLTGKGVLVASIDTGVDGHHPALADRYRGLRADAAAAWREPLDSDFPNDPVGHGTHTLGTVLGREPGDTVGIAPDAEWIAAGVVDRGLSFAETISDLLDAFQWLADPDGDPLTRSDIPDVVLNAWGIPRGILPDCDNTFWQVVDNLEALGAVVVFAAGNEGPALSTLRLPADRGDAPLKCFAVGAVDATNASAGPALFSSRGPITCNADLVKPELVAPGVGIRSCAAGGGYRLLTGTSMAAPHVVGAIALLRQHNPDATPEEIKQALIGGALDLGDPGPDYGAGYGLLDIPRALDLLPPALPIRWDWKTPTLAVSPDTIIEAAWVSIPLTLRNEGRSFEEVQIDVAPGPGIDRILDQTTFETDYLAAGHSELELALRLLPGTRTTGDRVWLDVHLRARVPIIDTLIRVGIPVGAPPARSALLVRAGALTATASNFGRLDPQGAELAGVDFPQFSFQGRTLPFEGGLRVISPDGDVAAFAGTMPFEPAPDGLLQPGDVRVLARTKFRDTRRVNPAGVELTQVVYAPAPGPGDYLIYNYAWERLFDDQEPVRFGGWFHWDLSDATPIEVSPSEHGFLVQSAYGCVGAIWLSQPPVTSAADYEADLSELPAWDARAAMPAAGSSFLVGLTESNASKRADGSFAFALVAAPSVEEWQQAAVRAKAQYAQLAASDGELRPSAFELFPGYPNPFNPSTTIHYVLDRAGRVRLDIFNVLGQHVRSLVDAYQEAGEYRIRWDARQDSGEALPSGVYLVRISAADLHQTRKLTLVR